MEVSAVVLGTADPAGLAAFYQRLLGWTVADKAGPRPGYPAEDGWAMLKPPAGATGLRALSIQWEPHYEPPAWPPVEGRQQTMLHLDIAVDDLDTGVAWALRSGAALAGHQPQEDVRVMLDPAGHPFCLFTASAG